MIHQEGHHAPPYYASNHEPLAHSEPHAQDGRPAYAFHLVSTSQQYPEPPSGSGLYGYPLAQLPVMPPQLQAMPSCPPGVDQYAPTGTVTTLNSLGYTIDPAVHPLVAPHLSPDEMTDSNVTKRKRSVPAPLSGTAKCLSPTPGQERKSRKGSAWACASCRQQKLRCDDIRDNACGKCRLNGLECQFPPQSPPPINNPTNAQALNHDSVERGTAFDAAPAGAHTGVDTGPKYVAQEPKADLDDVVLKQGAEIVQLKANAMEKRLNSILGVSGLQFTTARLKTLETELYAHKHGRTGHKSRMVATFQQPPPLSLPMDINRLVVRGESNWAKSGEERAKFSFLLNPGQNMTPPLSPRTQEAFPSLRIWRPARQPVESSPKSRILPDPSHWKPSPNMSNDDLTDDGIDYEEPSPDPDRRDKLTWSGRQPLAQRTPEHDAISRRFVVLKEAKRWFNGFLKVWGNQYSWSLNSTGSFRSVRTKSSLLVEAVLAVVAAHTGYKFINFHLLISSRELVRQLCIFGDGVDPNDMDIQGIMILVLNAHLHSFMIFAYHLYATLGYNLVFAKLTDLNIRGTAAERELIEKGRAWLVFVVHSTVICIFENKHPFASQDSALDTKHMRLLKRSLYSCPEFDRHLEAHLEISALLRQIQLNISPRDQPFLSDTEKIYRAHGFYQDIMAWQTKWAAMLPILAGSENMNGIRQLEDPTQYMIMYLAYVAAGPFDMLADGEDILRVKGKLELMLMGYNIALRIVEVALTFYKEPSCSPLPFHVPYHHSAFGLAVAMIAYGVLLIPGYVNYLKGSRIIRHLKEMQVRKEDGTSLEFHDVFKKIVDRLDELEEAYTVDGFSLCSDDPQDDDSAQVGYGHVDQNASGGMWQGLERWRKVASIPADEAQDLSELARASEFWHLSGVDTEMEQLEERLRQTQISTQ